MALCIHPKFMGSASTWNPTTLAKIPNMRALGEPVGSQMVEHAKQACLGETDHATKQKKRAPAVRFSWWLAEDCNKHYVT